MTKRIHINTDASCFHQYGYMSYAFWISGENINIQDFGIVENVYSAMEAEYISLHKALDTLIEFNYDFDQIVVKCDNVRVRNKYIDNGMSPLTKGLYYKFKELVQVTSKIFGAKPRNIKFKYTQARKGIDDDMNRNKWCDRKAKEIGRKELYKYGNFKKAKINIMSKYYRLIRNILDTN